MKYLIILLVALVGCASQPPKKLKVKQDCGPKLPRFERTFSCTQRLARDFSEDYTLESIVNACERMMKRSRK